MRWLFRVIAFAAVVAAVLFGWCLYQGVSTSLHAENGLHAALLTVQLLDDYVVQNEGQWPRSWNDLETLPERDWAMFQWPKDSREVQQYVVVDFSADPLRLARQGVDEFDAVRPIGPHYPFKDKGSVDALLRAIHERAKQ